MIGTFRQWCPLPLPSGRLASLLGNLVLISLLTGSGACKRPSSKRSPPVDGAPEPPRQRVPGIPIEGLGVVRVGQRLDPGRLRTEGPDRFKRWGRTALRERTRFSRAYPISPGFGNRLEPTHIYLREELWIQAGRVVQVGQGFTVVKQQCTPQMKATFERLSAVIRSCMTKDAFVLRQSGRQGARHYLCERGQVALKIDLRPVVPEFTDERETRAGMLTVSQFLRADVSGWLRQRFERGQTSSASELFKELAPITKHLSACPAGMR